MKICKHHITLFKNTAAKYIEWHSEDSDQAHVDIFVSKVMQCTHHKTMHKVEYSYA